MNSSTEISPDTQLLLDELRKLSGQFKQFTVQVASWGARVATQSATTRVDVVADNWGGFFDGGDNSDEQHYEAPIVADGWGGLFDGGLDEARSVVADNWDGLFEQPARILVEPAAINVADGADIVFVGLTSTGPDAPLDVGQEFIQCGPLDSAPDATSTTIIVQIKPEQSVPEEYPHQIHVETVLPSVGNEVVDTNQVPQKEAKHSGNLGGALLLLCARNEVQICVDAVAVEREKVQIDNIATIEETISPPPAVPAGPLRLSQPRLAHPAPPAWRFRPRRAPLLRWPRRARPRLRRFRGLWRAPPRLPRLRRSQRAPPRPPWLQRPRRAFPRLLRRRRRRRTAGVEACHPLQPTQHGLVVRHRRMRLPRQLLRAITTGPTRDAAMASSISTPRNASSMVLATALSKSSAHSIHATRVFDEMWNKSVPMKPGSRDGAVCRDFGHLLLLVCWYRLHQSCIITWLRRSTPSCIIELQPWPPPVQSEQAVGVQIRSCCIFGGLVQLIRLLHLLSQWTSNFLSVQSSHMQRWMDSSMLRFGIILMFIAAQACVFLHEGKFSEPTHSTMSNWIAGDQTYTEKPGHDFSLTTSSEIVEALNSGALAIPSGSKFLLSASNYLLSVQRKCGGNCQCLLLEVPGQKSRVARGKADGAHLAVAEILLVPSIIVTGYFLHLSGWVVTHYKPPWLPPQRNMTWFQLFVSFVIHWSLCQSTVPLFPCVSCQEYWKLWLKLHQIAVQVAELNDIKLSCTWLSVYMIQLFPGKLQALTIIFLHLVNDKRAMLLLGVGQWGMILSLAYMFKREFLYKDICENSECLVLDGVPLQFEIKGEAVHHRPIFCGYAVSVHLTTSLSVVWCYHRHLSVSVHATDGSDGVCLPNAMNATEIPVENDRPASTLFATWSLCWLQLSEGHRALPNAQRTLHSSTFMLTRSVLLRALLVAQSVSLVLYWELMWQYNADCLSSTPSEPEFLQFPWDPGGSILLHRLGGKPSLKEGGMSAVSYGWAFI